MPPRRNSLLLQAALLVASAAPARARIGPPPLVPGRKLHARASRRQLVLASITPPQAQLAARPSSDELLDTALQGLKYFSWALDVAIFAPFLAQLPVIGNLLALEPIRMVLTPVELVMQPYFAAWRSLIPIHRPIDLSLLPAFYAPALARRELMKRKFNKLRAAHEAQLAVQAAEQEQQKQIAGGGVVPKGAKAAVAAVGGAAVFTGLALAASKARASSSFGDGGVAGLDDIAEPVAE